MYTKLKGVFTNLKRDQGRVGCTFYHVQTLAGTLLTPGVLDREVAMCDLSPLQL